MIQNDLYTSYDSSKIDDIVFKNDSFCNNDDDQSFSLVNELFRSSRFDNNHYHHP